MSSFFLELSVFRINVSIFIFNLVFLKIIYRVFLEAGVQYHLERAEDEPGHALDLDKTLADVRSLTFHAVRDNSKRAASTPKEESLKDTLQSFTVTWVKKWAKFEATIGEGKGLLTKHF